MNLSAAKRQELTVIERDRALNAETLQEMTKDELQRDSWVFVTRKQRFVSRLSASSRGR